MQREGDGMESAIDDYLSKMTTARKQEAASLFVHQFQRFEDVPLLPE
jgi:hypothetical protein